MIERAVLTLGLGNPYFTELAVNLARSFQYWHRDSDIQFHLVSDHPELVPTDLTGVRTTAVEPRSYGIGFGSKLRLDQLAPAPQTLFIDADCLCYGRLEQVFERFRGHAVSVVGWAMESGHWCGDVETRCRELGVASVYRFVGGIYYLEPGPRCTAVYERARQLEARYDELGLARLRGQPNEEPLVSLAMAIEGQTPVPDDGTIKADAMHFQSGMDVDVLAGTARLYNTRGTPSYVADWPVTESRPLIVHYNAHFAQRDPYLSEAKRLRLVLGNGWPASAATLFTRVTTTWPNRLVSGAKDLLRPAYHRVIGPRRISPSPRL